MKEKQTTVRTRFAPSPSGFLHVGGARTALFNYLYARATGGSFVLRVEDTDQERSTPESERIILDSLKWLNIHADEGPDEGGSYGPYRQSERLHIYEKYTKTLLEKKLAYPCFCTDHELEEKQAQSKKLGLPHVYDGRCRNLTEEERKAKIDAGTPFAIRFQVDPEEIVVEDLVQGRVKFDARLIGDFIIVKSDGFPSYNYAVVIDDHEMEISHIIRGVGHLSNTPRQILIHRALDLPLPNYAHISEIVGTDKKKLSKRRGATSVLFFRDLGYLSEGFVNYMALLGWYPDDGVEFMPDGKLESKFDVLRCSKSPAMFDFFLSEKAEQQGPEFDPSGLSKEELGAFINQKSKLNWLNNKYIRHMELEKIWPLAKEQLQKSPEIETLLSQDEGKIKTTFESVRVYLSTLNEAESYIKEILKEADGPDSNEAKEWISSEDSKSLIHAFIEILAKEKPEEPEQFTECMKKAGKETGQKGKNLFMPIRVASTGSMQGLELPSLFAILGWEGVIRRIQNITKI